MRAVVRRKYGSEDTLELVEAERPEPDADSVVVRVRAASINPADWYGMNGTPLLGRVAMGIRGPRSDRLGVDYAGTVEAVGTNVTEFRAGDEVFGGRSGALAEYVAARADRAIVTRPQNITPEEAAAVPVAAITALQGLRDKGRIQARHKVLVNGASGGVGTFAVQIAKTFGAEVTGVCSTRNVELVRSLGADHVIDYTRQDFTAGGQRYDLLLDVAGSKPWSACARVLEREAILVIVGAPKGSRLLGPLAHIARLRLASLRSSQRAMFLVAKLVKEDLLVLRGLLEAGTVKPVVDREFALTEVSDAFRYLGEGHARGKIVVTI